MPKTSRKTHAKAKTKRVARQPQPPAISTASLSDEASQTAPVTTNIRRLPSVWKLTATSLQLLRQNWRLLIGIVAIYAILSLVLVRGLTNNADINTLRQQLNQASNGQYAQLASGVGVFAYLIGSAAANLSGGYQLFLLLVTSLAIIWALQQITIGQRTSVRSAYYRGMSPLVPLVLVLLVIGLQLLPLALGLTAYSILINNGILIGFLEQTLAIVLLIGMAILSLYMVSSSAIALYLVTTPGMTPRQALRAAKQLARGQRWTLMRKIAYVPLALLISGTIIMVPAIGAFGGGAAAVFFVFTLAGLLTMHTYLYTLYRVVAHEEAH